MKNRIVLPPMAHIMSDDSGAVTDAQIKHYVRCAKAGVGMLIVEHAYVQHDGRIGKHQLGIHDDALVPGLCHLAEAVKTYGTVAGIQITHGGGLTTQVTAGTQPLAPSDGIIPGGTEPAQALTRTKIESIVNAFVAAARRAVEAGFDFVEIHGAHGYLLSEFLSPLTNRRTDKYGGDLTNRLRLPLQIIKAVRQVVDNDHLLLYRLGANDYMPGGLTEAEGRQAAKVLAAVGVDLLDISGGLIGAELPGWDKIRQGYFVPMAAAIRSKVDVPVVVAGGITDPHFANQVVSTGQVNLVAIGRAMLADPDWVIKARVKLQSSGYLAMGPKK